MANYIGNQPLQGEFKKLDSIASQFNGSSVSFALEYNSVGQSVGDASQLIVSLNGVVQEPLTAYTLTTGGSYIQFVTAPSSGDTCHIVMLGGVGATTTPTDNSVTSDKIVAGAVTSSKISIDGDISFPDDDKLIFGAGSDLQIYHSSNYNFIKGTNTGTVIHDAYIGLANQDNNQNLLNASEGGAVNAYFAGALKLSTTNTGIDVTGTTETSLDLNVGGAVKGNAGTRAISVGEAGSVNGGLQLWGTTTGTHYVQFGDESGTSSNHYRGYMAYSHSSDSLFFGTSSNTRVTIDSIGYVGIGTTNPTQPLEIKFSDNTGGKNGLTLHNTSTSASAAYCGLVMKAENATVTGDIFAVPSTGSVFSGGALLLRTQTNHPIVFQTNSSNKMVIKANGNVGIGETNPQYSLHLSKTGSNYIQIDNDQQSVTAFLGTAGDHLWLGTSTNHELNFYVNSNIEMTVDTSGNVLPGADAAQDLGSTSLRWNNVYTTDLQLSNMGKEGGNDVDGTTGNWTLQEGAEDLFIINNNTGKKYRIPLEEVV